MLSKHILFIQRANHELHNVVAYSNELSGGDRLLIIIRAYLILILMFMFQ